MSENELSTRGPVVTPARIIAAICVVVPFIAVLWVPLYDKDKPELGGFPFYFWWQLLWVAVTAGLMGLAYFVVRREELARKAAAGGTATVVAPRSEPTKPTELTEPAEPAVTTEPVVITEPAVATESESTEGGVLEGDTE